MAFKEVIELRADKTAEMKNAGDTVSGYYLGCKSVTTDMGTSKFHVFTTAEGNVGVWGSKGLDSKLAAVEPSVMTKVTFQGKTKIKGTAKTFKNFKVEYDTENTTDISGLAIPTKASSSGTSASSEDESEEDEDDIFDEVDKVANLLSK